MIFLGAEITCLLNAKKFIMLSTMKGSEYGVGGGEAKTGSCRTSEKKKYRDRNS